MMNTLLIAQVIRLDQCSDLKSKISACLNHFFPEYDQIFSNMFGCYSTQILLNSFIP